MCYHIWSRSLQPFSIATAVLPLLSVAGCTGTDAPSGWSGTVTDSAGIQLIENPAEGTWTADEAWTVEEVLSVGGADAMQDSQFGSITGIDVNVDGNIYVADAQAQNVSVFDASGTYERTIGRPGSGPGEFGESVAGVFVVGDEVLVPDLANQRVSRFRPDGTLLSDRRLNMSRGVPLRFDVIAGGEFVAQRRLIVPRDSVASTRDAIVTVTPEGQVADTVAQFAAGQSVRITGGIPRIRQYAPDPMWDADPTGRLVTAMTDAWRFEVRGPDGALQQVVSRPYERRRVTARDRQSVKDALREKYEGQGVPPEASEAVIDAMDFSDYFPAFTSVVLGPKDSLWVQTLLPDDELTARGATLAVEDMGSRTWGVFGADGHYLGTVAFPTRFQPVRAVRDRFYGVATNDLDVQSVKVYRIVTSSRG